MTNLVQILGSMGIRLIRVLFISALLFFNAFVLYFMYSPSKINHLEYLPGNSLVTFSVNTREISGKLAASALFSREDFSRLLQQEEGEGPEMDLSSFQGVNLLGRMSVAILPGEGETPFFSVALLDLYSQEVFKTSVLTAEEKPVIEKAEGFEYFHKGDKTTIGFNENVLINISGSDQASKRLGVLNDLFSGKYASKGESLWLTDNASDFNMLLRFPEQQLNDAPSLKGIIGAFISSIRVNGHFKQDAIGFTSEVLAGSENLNAQELFPAHQTASEVPGEEEDGFLRVFLSPEPVSFIDYMAKTNKLGLPDSLSSRVYSKLKEVMGGKILLESDGVRMAKIKFYEPRFDREEERSIPFPDFRFGIALKDSTGLKEWLDGLVQDSLIRTDGILYYYDTPFDFPYQIRLYKNCLSVSSTSRFIEELKNDYKGFSNWMYFNVPNFIQQIPIKSPVGFMIRGVMEEISTVHYGFAYSESAGKDFVNWKGSIYYNEKKMHSLIETLLFLQKASALIVM